MYPPGNKEITDFTPLNMVILSTEEEVESEVEVEEEEIGFRKDRWIDLMEDSEEDTLRVTVQEHNKPQQIVHNQIDRNKIGLYPPT